MIRRLVDFFLGKLCFIFFVLLHFVYQLQLEIRERIWWDLRLMTRRLVQCWPSYSTYGEVGRLAKETQELVRTPQHIAISVVTKRPLGAVATLLRNLNLSKEGEVKSQSSISGDSNEEVDLQALARVISWAWVANVPVISLYDYKGVLKSQYRELSHYVQEELCQSLWAVKRADEPPTLKFHNVPKTNGYMNGNSHSNGTNGVKSKETLHICLYSNEDGKAGIVRAATGIFKDILDSKSSDSCPESIETSKGAEEINENLLNARINQVIDWPIIIKSSIAKTEPDLLVILGNIKSSLGFLPWHIRLTEIHWLPPLPKIEMRDFLQSLTKYATCHQRFGT